MKVISIIVARQYSPIRKMNVVSQLALTIK